MYLGMKRHHPALYRIRNSPYLNHLAATRKPASFAQESTTKTGKELAARPN